MKEALCLLCNQDNASVLLINKGDPFRTSINGRETRYVVCNLCGFVYQNPKLDEQEIENLYTKETYDKKDTRITEAYQQKKEEYAKQSFDWIAKHRQVSTQTNESKILDIGCNTGALLSLFKQQGWQCYGVEPSQNMSTIAKERYGLTQVSTHLFKEGLFAPASFSFVSLLHTLEHLENPAIMLKEIAQVLNPDGTVYIEVPDIYQPKSCFYTSYFAAPHLYVFSPHSLERLLAQHGFQTIARGAVPRGICVLAKKAEPRDLPLTDDSTNIIFQITQYKKIHDRHAFLYRYIAQSLPARILIKLRLPIISSALSRCTERVRVNKII